MAYCIFFYYYMILNFKRKKKRGITLKIKGTKIISPLKIQRQTSFGTGRGNSIMSCFYCTDSSNLVTYFSVLSKKTAAFPLLGYDVRIYVYIKPQKLMN